MIYAVVLAAGASSRMGDAGPKALVRLPDGPTFVQRIADTARAGGCAGVVVVLGPPHGDRIRAALPPGIATAFNPRPERGMLSSVQAGIAALPANATQALVWPVDIPFVRPETVRAILAAAPGQGQLVIPRSGKRGGHPMRIPRSRFGELAALDPDEGLKGLIDAAPDRVTHLSVDDPGVLKDVDTPADLPQRKR